jgi:hypothetical protein
MPKKMGMMPGGEKGRKGYSGLAHLVFEIIIQESRLDVAYLVNRRPSEPQKKNRRI